MGIKDIERVDKKIEKEKEREKEMKISLLLSKRISVCLSVCDEIAPTKNPPPPIKLRLKVREGGLLPPPPQGPLEASRGVATIREFNRFLAFVP